MLHLADTNDKLQLVTSAAVTVDVFASYTDLSGTTVTPAKQLTAITTATTTDIVAAPGASTVRRIHTLFVRNKHATSSVDVTVVFDDNATDYEIHKATLLAGEMLEYVEGLGWFTLAAASSIAQVPSWYGNIHAAYGRSDPQQLLRMAQMAGTVAATPTNITATVARIAYFRPPADITVNKIRYYGVGATTTIYRIAIYNGDTLARVLTETAFSTTANAWGEIGSALGLALTKDQLYFIACSVNTTGTTAGVLCMGPTIAATTGLISVLPKSWPGNLDIDNSHMDGAFAQGAVTAGALPDPFPTVAAQTAWTGGMPLFFLDNSNA